MASVVPAKAAGTTLIIYSSFIDAMIVLLIVALAAFLVARVVARRKRPAPAAALVSKECPYCLQSIPLKATRCAYCTSEVR